MNKRLNVLGAVSLTLSLAFLNLGLSYLGGKAAYSPSLQGNSPGYSSGKVILSLLAAFIFFGLFILKERHANNPLINLKMFARPNFTAACLANFLVGFALITAMVNVPLFINTILTTGSDIDQLIKDAAVDTGRLLAVMTASMAVFSLIGGWMTKTWGYRPPVLIGLTLGVIGFLQMGGWSTEVTHFRMGQHLNLIGMGFGLVIAPLSTAIVNSVSQWTRGIASSLAILFRMVGMSVGLSAITAWSLNRFYSLSQKYTIQELGAALPDINQQIYSETFFLAGVVLVIAFLPSLSLQKQ
jgi:MFS family permease